MQYSMSVVSKLTGIQGHTLRIWEKRYKFIIANRKDSGIRYYTEDQVKTLLNVALLLKSGHRISSISKMSPEEIFQKSMELYAADTEDLKVHIQAFLHYVFVFNELQFNQKFADLKDKMGMFPLMTDVIYPLLRRIGGLWSNNRAIPANEHFLSNLIRQKLNSEIDALPIEKDPKDSVILFLPEGQSHELGLLLAHYLFKKHGWKVVYLGANLPIDNLSYTLESTGIRLAFTLIQFYEKKMIEKLGSVLEQNIDFNLILSGANDNLKPLLEYNNVQYIPDPEAMADFIS